MLLLLLAAPPWAAASAVAVAVADDGAAPPPAVQPADVETDLQSWMHGNTLTGGWFGARQYLLDLGIEPTLTYAADILANPVGGRVRKLRYFHDIFVGLDFDLEKLVAIPGAELQVSMSSRAGHDLSRDIGNVFNVSQTCCQPQTRLVTLAWHQALLDDRLDLRVGHIVMGDDFIVSPLYALFVTSGIDANPGSLGFNFPFSEYPDSSAGLRIRGRPIEPLSLSLGLYDGNPNFTGIHGTDFDFSFDDGAVILAEVQYRWVRGSGAAALTGHYTLGGSYDTGRFVPFDGGGSAYVHGNGGMYAAVDQQVVSFGDPAAGRGLVPFAAVTGAPATDINLVPFFVNGGLVVQGPWAARPDDALLFGLVFGRFSSALDSPPGESAMTYEMVLEWSYVIQLTPWLQLQPDLQYVIRPGGTGTIPDALVVGAQLALTL